VTRSASEAGQLTRSRPSTIVTSNPAAARASRAASKFATPTSTPPAPALASRSWIGPTATHRPASMTATRSHIFSASSRRWLDTMTVRPWSASETSSRRISAIPAGSRPLAGSSSTTTSGSRSRAAAIPSRWRIPSEYVATGSSARSASPAAPSARATPSAPIRSSRANNARFRRPVRDGARPGVSIRAPIRLITRCKSVLLSAPSTLQTPDVGLMSPSRQRSAVVLPAPLRPSSPNTPPDGTTRSSLSRATRPPPPLPYHLVTSTISTIAFFGGGPTTSPTGRVVRGSRAISLRG
jgi:hypothetical protein